MFICARALSFQLFLLSVFPYLFFNFCVPGYFVLILGLFMIRVFVRLFLFLCLKVSLCIFVLSSDHLFLVFVVYLYLVFVFEGEGGKCISKASKQDSFSQP